MSKYSNKTHGGARVNAGRKKGSSAYGESTRPLRVPESLVPAITRLLENRKRSFDSFANHEAILLPALTSANIPLPLFSGKVSAGFPSPADDYVEKTLDLNELLVKKPAATFFARAEGLSMINAGIHPNDVLVVDRSIEPSSGMVVICALNGELTVKRLVQQNGQWHLQAENPDYPNIDIQEELDLVIWGVVTDVIHRLLP